MPTAIWWIRRDLRLEDNEALAAASAVGRVLPVFVDDPFFERYSSSPRAAYLEGALGRLAHSIEASGGSLLRVAGSPERVLPELVRSVAAREVHATGEYTPYARVRDEAVRAALGVPLVLSGSSYAVTPGSLRVDGRPFRVFSAFHRRWVESPMATTGPVPVSWAAAPDSSARWRGPVPPLVEGPVWQERWDAFQESTLAGYAGSRDLPAADATSRMSAALRFGEVHPVRLVRAAGAGSEFARQLAWRDFYADMLWSDPSLAWHNADRRFDRLAVDVDAAARGRFAAFTSASTGFPIVDAGVRELLDTGFVHNRVRMIVASFLVKDLHLPWQWGARFFMCHLVDGDLASNNLSWQWVAGSGFDAAPYHRVFNPVAQGTRFDPEGAYVRRHLPSLSAVPDRHVHAPWLSTTGVPPGYPPPMLDHAAERAEALSRWEAMRSR